MLLLNLRYHAIQITCVRSLSAGVLTLDAQVDPGPRGGPANAGAYYSELNITEQLFFTQALERFKEVDSVSGTAPNEAGSGLGPTFNGNSCAMCHAQPAAGSSPGLTSKQNPVPNPQLALATLDGAINVVPSFITVQGLCAKRASFQLQPRPMRRPMVAYTVYSLFKAARMRAAVSFRSPISPLNSPTTM